MRLIDADALAETLGITDIHCCHKCALSDPNTYFSCCIKSEDFVEACEAIEKAPTIKLEWEKPPMVKGIEEGDRVVMIGHISHDPVFRQYRYNVDGWMQAPEWLEVPKKYEE